MKSRLLAAAFCLLVSGATAAEESLASISSLDVPRYMGTWYEVARYPNWFQKKCAGNAKAEYALGADGGVQVVNSCRLSGGEYTEARGVARQVGPSDSPKLEVRFAPAWLSFLPMVWGDYWVIDLDGDYQLAAVSEPTRQFLWILSRNPKVDREAYEALLARLAGKGFDIGRLEITPQD